MHKHHAVVDIILDQKNNLLCGITSTVEAMKGICQSAQNLLEMSVLIIVMFLLHAVKFQYFALALLHQR